MKTLRAVLIGGIILLNFILQTTLLPYASIGGALPNTALIIIVSCGLLRGQWEGAAAGFFAGFLQDIFFGTSIGFYALLGIFAGLLAGINQKDFYRENYLLPMIICSIITLIYEGAVFFFGFFLRGETNILYFLIRLALPEAVYTSILSIPIYRLLFGINEWLELKEKYRHRLF